MINEFVFFAHQFGSDAEQEVNRVFCETQEQAWNKAKFMYPNTYICIRIEKGRSFESFDQFLQERNNFKTLQTK